MEVQNNKTGRPLEYYTSLYRALDPAEAAKRCGISFDGASFAVSFLGFELLVDWPEFKLRPVCAEECPHSLTEDYAKIFILRYILEGTYTGESGEFLSYREFPWGSVYDANFQGRCIKRLAFSFGSKPELFSKAGEMLGGVPLGKGDASFEFSLLAGFKVRVILYAADDEFPPSSQFLFSSNHVNAFMAEDLAVIGDLIINALKELSKR
ncbi:MAG: DUF3786 domain-containing protein [Oscillospiraceae bacterium]|nr:DUF3786 domain-containing protein [Oscillospiraceae bacterium]